MQRRLAQAKAGEEVLSAAVDAIRDEALLNFLLYTGLRVSERAALCVDDVVLNGKSGLVTVASLMGHSSVATTAIYTQPSEAVWLGQWQGEITFLSQIHCIPHVFTV
ncbi:MAG TPA: hypothetical protein PKZ84_19705 [Anaerolineae bacterium]|nr:hypothetical protein [Anaerolineae bacterium]HQI86893.1 hypothetical protein [Anaerolineae bacterium]